MDKTEREREAERDISGEREREREREILSFLRRARFSFFSYIC